MPGPARAYSSTWSIQISWKKNCAHCFNITLSLIRVSNVCMRACECDLSETTSWRTVLPETGCELDCTIGVQLIGGPVAKSDISLPFMYVNGHIECLTVVGSSENRTRVVINNITFRTYTYVTTIYIICVFVYVPTQIYNIHMCMCWCMEHIILDTNRPFSIFLHLSYISHIMHIIYFTTVQEMTIWRVKMSFVSTILIGNGSKRLKLCQTHFYGWLNNKCVYLF